MYLALFSVAFGSGLLFLQAAALFHLLDLEHYVAFRAVLNTMNVAAPFLCLGFDNAAPVLRRMDPLFPYFWNIVAALFGAFLLLTAVSFLLPAASELRPLALGLAASTSIAAALAVANYYRAEGATRRYFLRINVIDKLVRTVIILGLAYLIRDLLLWSVLMSTLSFAYVGFSSWNTGVRPQFSLQIFTRHLRVGFPYIFSVLGVVFLTRMPFYAAYVSEPDLVTAKIDIWLLFSMFLLIPVLNKSKIEEAVTTALPREYVAAMRRAWGAVMAQEVLIIGGIAVVAGAAVWAGYAAIADLFGIVFPLMLGMILVASQPNYVQLLCFFDNYAAGVRTSLVIGVMAIVVYLPRSFVEGLSIPWLFVVSALGYCVIGHRVARVLDVKSGDFWRFKDALLLGGCSAAALGIVRLVLPMITK